MNCRDVYFQRHWVVFFTGQAEPRTISLHFVPQTLPFLDSFQVDNFPQDTNGLEDLFCDSTSEYLTNLEIGY